MIDLRRLNMKRFVKAFCVFFTLMLLCSCQNSDPSLYVKSRMADGSGEAMVVVDALMEKNTYEAVDAVTFTVRVGVGGNGLNRLTGEEYAELTVSGDGCLINGKNQPFLQTFEDFFTNDAFRPTIVEGRLWLAYPDKTPNYHLDVEITIPKEVIRGKLTFKLQTHVDSVHEYQEAFIYFQREGDQLVFYNEIQPFDPHEST